MSAPLTTDYQREQLARVIRGTLVKCGTCGVYVAKGHTCGDEKKALMSSTLPDSSTQ